MKRWIARLVLLGASTLFCFLILEIGVRLTGHGVVGEREGNVVHHKVPEFEHTAVLNSLDLRDTEVEAKATGERRILALGDSFTYGLGVEEPDCYVRRTESLLRERWAEADRPGSLRVVNGGIGKGPTTQVTWLEQTGLGLEPDLVVLGYFIGNDPYDDLAWHEAGGDGEPGEGSLVRRILRSSAALDWTWSRLVGLRAVDRMLFKLGLRQGEAGLYLVDPPEVEQRAWRYSLGAVEKIHAMLDERGIDFVVMIIPASEQVRYGESARGPGEDYRKPNRVLGEFFDEQGIAYLDLLPKMRADEERDGLYYVRDLHWTPAGHRFASELLAERLWAQLGPVGDALPRIIMSIR